MSAPPVPDIAAGNEAFSTAMRAFHAWEAGDLSDALNAYESTRLLSTTGTSTTSITIGTGDKTFTTQAGLGFVAGQSVNVASTANPANYMSGIVKSYSGTTLVVTVITVGGSGTIASWAIALGLSGGGASLGTNTFTAAQNFAQGADIASAATINLTSATGNILTVTGTVATSAVTLGAGMTRIVRAAAAWPLTYNATTNNITGGVSIVLEAGDHVIYHNLSGVIYGLIIKASGRAVVSQKDIQPITASVGSNALTITLNPTILDFRSATIGSGTVNTRNIAAAISVVVSSGSTLGTTNAVQSRLAVLAIDNAGTVELAVVNIAGGTSLDETGIISTTAEGGAGAADSATTIYSTTARSNVAYRVVGYVESTQATAGTWATAPSTIQGYGGQAFSALSSFGYGQTWQTFTVGATRVLATTYYNTTGKPILVKISQASATGTQIIVDGVNTGVSGGLATSNTVNVAIVPVGSSYSVTGAATTWTELR